MQLRQAGSRLFAISIFSLLLVVGVSDVAQAKPKYSVVVLKEAAPKDQVSKDVAGLLEPVALRVLNRKQKPYVDVWLRRQLTPQKENKETGIAYGQIPEGSLLGVIRFHARGSDFRGDRFKPGVFTMRTAIQPQDGEHLGVSETRDFIALAPAKIDAKTAALPTKEVVKLSTKASGSKHPSILYLIKLFDKAKKLPRIVEEEDLELWILDCEIRNGAAKDGPAKDETAGKKDATSSLKLRPLRLSIVIEGESEEA